jgi:hypothetical protein
MLTGMTRLFCSLSVFIFIVLMYTSLLPICMLIGLWSMGLFWEKCHNVCWLGMVCLQLRVRSLKENVFDKVNFKLFYKFRRV